MKLRKIVRGSLAAAIILFALFAAGTIEQDPSLAFILILIAIPLIALVTVAVARSSRV